MSNKYGDKYRVHNWVKFDYSQIGEYIDENHTDKPMRNDELVDLLNKQHNQIKELEKENEKLKIDIMGQSEEIEILSDENKRLKQ